MLGDHAGVKLEIPDKRSLEGLPWRLVVRGYRRHGLHPWGNKTPKATWHSQKKKKMIRNSPILGD